jgi:Ca-activated chloride channel family protein
MREFNFLYPELFAIFVLYLACNLFCKEKIRAIYFPNLSFFGYKRDYLTYIYKYLALFFVVTTLASPVIIDRFEPENREGVDIVLSIDVSGSMSESGFGKSSESKFEVIKELSKDFIRERVNDNIGIVLFGDYAFINTPITYEKDVLIELVDLLELSMAGDSTALGDGIAMSVRNFKTSKAKSKVVILLTDGRDNTGKILPKEATLFAKNRGIKIYTIGVGEDFDRDMLKYIAKESLGEFFAVSDSLELKSVFAKINSLESSKIRSSEYLKKEYLFYYPLISAIIFLLLFIIRRYKSF